MEKVKSSDIDSVGWEDGELTIQFNNGRQYKYEAPYDIYNRLLSAPSKGQFFHGFIKGIYKMK